MSNLQQHLQWLRTGQRRSQPRKLADVLDVTENWNTYSSPDLLQQYRLEARFRVDVLVPEDDNLLVQRLIRRDSERKIIEAVFGEFREPLGEVLYHLHQRDWEAATKHIYQIQQQMFEVETQ